LRADELPITVLGLGRMGHACVHALAPHGYRITGWTRSDAPRELPTGVVHVYGNDALKPCLGGSSIVINTLPLTADTRGLLDERFFAAMPRGAGLINFGRGAHVVEADLRAALATGRIGHAVLDVFEREPLDEKHPFWRHPRVTVLPHVAALTDPRSAVQLVAANVQALLDGQPIANLVDRERGY